MATGNDGAEGAPPSAGPTPNREGRREPAVIEATAEEVKREPVEDVETRDSAAEETPESPPQTSRTPPSLSVRHLVPWFAVGLASLALLISLGVGAHLFVTTDGAIVDLQSATAKLEARTGVLDRQSAAVAALDHRVSAVESSLKTTMGRLAALQSEAKKAASVTETSPVAPPPNLDLAPLEQRVTAIEAQLKPLAATIAASKADAAADADNVRKAVARSSSAALVVVAQSLLDAVDGGGPFASELAAAQALGADANQLAPLRPSADKGVPTVNALADSFAPLAAPILTGSNSKKPRGILDRLERGASSLVRIRPVGAPSGDSRTALVARIEGALHHGDIAGAVAAWQQLPGPAKTVTADWVRAARARLEAERAARAILADAIDRLGHPKS